MTLLQLLEAGGGRAYYEYDFGDFSPEDSGGIHSYLDFMDALDDPADPQHAGAVELARGIGDGFTREDSIGQLPRQILPTCRRSGAADAPDLHFSGGTGQQGRPALGAI